MKHAAGIEEGSGRLVPKIAMAGQLDVIEADGGHERCVVRGQQVGVGAQMRIGGGIRSE